jgi:hypothetical protein
MDALMGPPSPWWLVVGILGLFIIDALRRREPPF